MDRVEVPHTRNAQLPCLLSPGKPLQPQGRYSALLDARTPKHHPVVSWLLSEECLNLHNRPPAVFSHHFEKTEERRGSGGVVMACEKSEWRSNITHDDPRTNTKQGGWARSYPGHSHSRTMHADEGFYHEQNMHLIDTSTHTEVKYLERRRRPWNCGNMRT